ncbi:hypothetical protein D3C72_1460570 [compost metagenome]
MTLEQAVTHVVDEDRVDIGGVGNGIAGPRRHDTVPVVIGNEEPVGKLPCGQIVVGAFMHDAFHARLNQKFRVMRVQQSNGTWLPRHMLGAVAAGFIGRDLCRLAHGDPPDEVADEKAVHGF